MVLSSQAEHLTNVYKTLERFGMNVTPIKDIQGVKAGLASHSPAFLLLDGDMEGVKPLLAEMVRSALYPPPYIIVAGAFSHSEDCAAMLNIGADACISKPISARNILSAVKAVFRREGRLARLQCGRLLPRIAHKELSIDPLRRTVTMRGDLITLTPKEFDILYLLAHHAGSVLTKEEIYRSVWNEAYDAASTGVSDHISSLRQKLKLDKKDKDYIQTVFGVGYRFANVEQEICL